MTIELVAMLFDFVFETRDLPDGIKALLARLQIPVLKAAMLDGAFFAKKSHPARLLVNALAQAGLGWSTVMGQEDPLYKKIDEIVHKILDGFTDNLGLFDELRDDLEAFLAEEEKAAEANGARHRPVMIAQLTHSGRYSKPSPAPKPMIPQRDPYRDPMTPQPKPDTNRKSRIPDDYPLVMDEYLDQLQDAYVEAARIAFEVGFVAVDIKSGSQCDSPIARPS